MLLPIFLVAILASANAGFLSSLIEKVPKLSPSEKIPFIPELLTNTTHDDAHLTVMELISKYGYDGELHKVTTSDGYILEVNRIKGRANSNDSYVQKPVAFVMHGLFVDSGTWALAGPERSLAFILADEGYDVWLGNARGNRYARGHINPKIKEKDYWNFSWHEIGIYDLPAMIDLVVKITGQKIYYIGHSQGTTSFFVMAIQRPEYQEHILEMHAMSPVAYCGRMKSPFLQLLAQFTFGIDALSHLIGLYEFNPNTEFTKAVQQLVCAENAITQPLCRNAIFLIAGFNYDQFDPKLLPVILGHAPASISTKQIVHYGQLIESGMLILSGKFKQFQSRLQDLFYPTIYNLNKIKTPIHAYYSVNDWLANPKDVEKTCSEVVNLRSKTLIEDKKFNHLDYMWAKDANKLIYYPIINNMKKSWK